MQATLLASGSLALLAAGLYLGLAVVSLRRRVRPEYRTPWRLFALWWTSIGANLALTGAVTIAAAAGVRDLPFYVAHAHLERVVLVAGLWALMAHVGFLLTGDRRTWLPAALFYAAYYLLVLFRLVSARPVGVALSEWARPALVTAPAAAGPWPLLVLAMLVIPPVVAAMLYFRLCFKTDDPQRRLRIAVTSWGIVLWFLVSVTAYLVSDSAVWQVANRVAGLVIAAAILHIATAPHGWRPLRRPDSPARPSQAPAEGTEARP